MMSGFLTRLIARSMVSSPVVRPRSGSLFARYAKRYQAADSIASASKPESRTMASREALGRPGRTSSAVWTESTSSTESRIAPADRENGAPAVFVGTSADEPIQSTLGGFDAVPSGRNAERPVVDEHAPGGELHGANIDHSKIGFESDRPHSSTVQSDSFAIRDIERPASLIANALHSSEDPPLAAPRRYGALVATPHAVPDSFRLGTSDPACDHKARELADGERAVQVTIGRVEVRAVVEQAPKREQKSQRATPPMSLEVYLNKRRPQ